MLHICGNSIVVGCSKLSKQDPCSVCTVSPPGNIESWTQNRVGGFLSKKVQNFPNTKPGWRFPIKKRFKESSKLSKHKTGLEVSYQRKFQGQQYPSITPSKLSCHHKTWSPMLESKSFKGRLCYSVSLPCYSLHESTVFEKKKNFLQKYNRLNKGFQCQQFPRS